MSERPTDNPPPMEWAGQHILSPLTKGGNLPFRRLCVEFGADVTVSEMAYARQLTRGSRSELALLRHHPTETAFGVQIAASSPDQAVEAGKLAVDRGAKFVDLNCGCPIHDVVRRGMGATLLKRETALVRIVEALAKELTVPVTVKIRAGWKEGEINAPSVAQKVEEVGAAALTLHARTREQRYSKAADWDLIGQLVQERNIPIVGNGDILTHYEARMRKEQSGCAAVMLARGALIKPWLFQELREGRELEPDAMERLGIYHRLAGFMKEHFRDDDKGRQRTMQFLPWHFSFFCRYRPMPEAEWLERSKEHPLLQTRLESNGEELSPLERLLRDPREDVHRQLAELLWDSESVDDAASRCETLIAELPPPSPDDAREIRVSNG